LDLDLRFHDMRHTRATRLLRGSGNLKAVQRLLGHADISTTADFYARVIVDDLRNLLDREKSPDQGPNRPSRRRPRPLKNKRKS
jgi:integrase